MYKLRAIIFLIKVLLSVIENFENFVQQPNVNMSVNVVQPAAPITAQPTQNQNVINNVIGGTTVLITF